MTNGNKAALYGAIAIVLAALIGLWATLITRPPTQGMAGKILSPNDGDRVENIFNVKGTIEKVPNGHYVWLAVKIGDNIWSKKQVNKNDRTWVERIEEYGETERFDLVLMVVDEASHQKILSWKERQEQEKNWSPIVGLGEKTILDAVQLRLRK